MNCKSSNIDLIIQIFSVLFVLISLIFPAKTGETGGIDKEVALVGNTSITEKKIFYKVQIEKAYGNEGATREVALMSLVNDAIEHETAAIYGVTITREEIDSFKRYVAEQTKAPEILQKVKLLFGTDTSSYERIYLAPKLVNLKLHDFYTRSPGIHEKERSLIEKAYGLVTAGIGFQEAAQECGMEFSAFNIEEKGTSLHPELRTYIVQNNTPVTDPLIPILGTFFPGEICRNIVEDDYRYRIIKLIERNGETYSVEAITIKKRSFYEWFKEEAAKIKIELIEPDLRKSTQTKYPDVWWIKK